MQLERSQPDSMYDGFLLTARFRGKLVGQKRAVHSKNMYKSQ